MVDVETLKQAIVQSVVELAKVMLVVVNEESRRQAMGIGHHNSVKALGQWISRPSLRQVMFDWNATEVTNIFLTRYYELTNEDKCQC